MFAKGDAQSRKLCSYTAVGRLDGKISRFVTWVLSALTMPLEIQLGMKCSSGQRQAKPDPTVGNILTSIAVPLPHSPKAILFRAWLARIGEFWASHKSPAPFQRPSTKIVRIPRLLCRMVHCKWIFYAYNIKRYMIILKSLWPTFSISGCPCGTVFRNVL